MPRQSAKRKARSELGRENMMKRWRGERETHRSPSPSPSSTASSSSSAVHVDPAAPPDFSLPRDIHASAASYRHGLLPEEMKKPYKSSDNGMVVLSLSRLQTLLNLIKCDCGNQVTSKVTREYFDCTINLICEECSETVHHSEPRKCTNSDLTEGNVYHSLSEGYGSAGLSRLSAAMGAKEITSRSFTRHAHYLYEEMETCYKEYESVTKACVDKSYENEGKERDDDETLNAHCSFDATWLTRGHKSKIGAAFVMDIYSGMILDYEILSNFCRACAIMRKRSAATFDDWYTTTHSGKCQSNFDGLSGAMEPEGAVRMWQRSEGKGYRYVTFLSDGDSNSFNAVCSLNGGKGPYASHTVKKEECINHVQKRMGTRLRKLKGELKEEKVTKTGRIQKRSLVGGKHQLTDKQIDALQKYYGKAIRDTVGTDVTTMKLRVMSGFFHAISRDGDGKSHHNFCDSSWCIFKKARDEGKPVPSHSIMKNYLRLDKKYEDQVKAIYLDLSSTPLLERCLRGETQNRNESFHAKLWHHQSKAKFAGLQRMTFVTQLTILDHNFGYEANHFLQHLGLSLTSASELSIQRMDKRKVTPRKAVKKKAKAKPDPGYQPGGF